MSSLKFIWTGRTKEYNYKDEAMYDVTVAVVNALLDNMELKF
jgi:hypothetical protein